MKTQAKIEVTGAKLNFRSRNSTSFVYVTCIVLGKQRCEEIVLSPEVTDIIKEQLVAFLTNELKE